MLSTRALVWAGRLGLLVSLAITAGCAGDAAPPNAPEGGAASKKAKFGAKHVLVMYAGSSHAPTSVTRTKDEARALATEIAAKARAKSARIEDLAAQYSDEPGAARRGGDIGRFAKEMVVPAFGAAVEALAVGETSDVVETEFGFHVILRTQ